MKQMIALLLVAAGIAHADPAAMSGAFSQGANFGTAQNAATKSGIVNGAGQATVPHASPTAPESSYFGSPGLSAPAAAKINACASVTPNSGSYDDQACNAVNFSQTNPAARPQFSIGPNDPVLANSRSILNDPAAIAGNIAGTYSGCTVQSITTPDIYETKTCTQYHTLQVNTCDRILIVTPYQTPGCSPGQFLTRVTANPCPACIDYLAYDFTCGTNNYLMHVFTILKSTGGVFQDLGSQYVPGTLNTTIPQTAGPSQINGYFCYQTYYSQSCSGANCSIGAWFYNPCQGTSYYGVSTFVMPTTVGFTDSWDNQCATLDARTQ